MMLVSSGTKEKIKLKNGIKPLKMQFNTTETEATVNGQPKEKKENFFVESKKLLEAYIKDRILLIKLEASKSAANATAGVVNGVLLALFGLFALNFVSITLG